MLLSGAPQVIASLTYILPTLLFANSASALTLYSRAIKSDENDALILHNKARAEALQCNPPESCNLHWDDTLRQHAQDWADHLASLGTTITQKSHSEGTGVCMTLPTAKL